MQCLEGIVAFAPSPFAVYRHDLGSTIEPLNFTT